MERASRIAFSSRIPHNQSIKAKFSCAQDQVFVVQAEIVIAPAVSNFVVWCAVLRKSGAVFYECCYDKCGSL